MGVMAVSLRDPGDDLVRALAGATAGAVGDRHERRVAAARARRSSPERQLRGVGLRREELERVRPPRGEQLGDVGHPDRLEAGCAMALAKVSDAADGVVTLTLNRPEKKNALHRGAR